MTTPLKKLTTSVSAWSVTALLALCIHTPSAAIADAPTMGWSSWNTYRVNISDSLIIKQADAMVRSGLKNAGYNHINIDDGYFGGRDDDGRLLTHPARFPNGLKPVVDHIHALGLKAGIYSDAGRNTCGSYYDNDTIARGVGFYGHDRQDAEFFFNETGFDFIKIDFCGGDPAQNSEHLDLDEQERYRAINEAIRATGRDDVRINACRWNYPGTWVGDVAFSWRISHDIQDNWTSVKDIINQSLYLSAYCRGGHYNDMDMLEVGRSLSDIEDRTHFGLWCVMSSPLLIGCDLTTIKPATLKLLTNPELIALNQDPLHLQAYVADVTDGCYILVKDIATYQGNRRCLAVFNPTDEDKSVNVSFATLDLAGQVNVRDIFDRKDLGTYTSRLSVNLAPHATRIYVLDASERLMRRLYEAETAFIGNYQEITNPKAIASGYYEADGQCSGGMKATNLGGSPDNYLLWDNVHVPSEDNYKLTVHWKTAETAEFTIVVNGVAVRTFNCPAADKLMTSELCVRLNKGDNSVRIENPTGHIPEIDCMTVAICV